MLAGQLFAQTEPDITGLWKGTLYNDTTQRYLKYEIAISENKGKLSGYTHTYFIVDDKEFHGVKKATIKRKDGKILVEDDKLIANNYPVEPAKGVRQLDVLTLEIKDGIMTLSGPFSTNRTKLYHSLTGSIMVQRKTNFNQSALVPHLEELGLADDLSFVQEIKKQEVVTRLKEDQTAIAEAKQEKIREKTIVSKIEEGQAVEKNESVLKEQPVVKTETKATEPVKPIPVVKQPVAKRELAKDVATNQPVNKAAETKANPEVKPIESEIVKTNAPAIAVVKETEVKTIESKSKPIVKKTPEPSPVKIAPAVLAAVDIKNRTIETIQSVIYQSDSLVLTLYDNGEVDGDTVSVLLNGEVIMPRVGLTTNAVRKTIYTKDLPDSVQIVMYAETLGSLPPNTGLLIVYDGKDRYEIRFSGDLKKNAAIVFRRKE